MTYTARRPLPGESPDYYLTYIKQVSQDDFLQVLKDNAVEFISFLSNIAEDKWDYRYAPDKWTVKEVILHLIDTERIMAYRALRIARNDKTPLPGFEQDDYIPYCNAHSRSPESVISEYEAVRQASIQLFQYLDDSHLESLGTASGNSFTPRALGFVIAGHQVHHVRVLEERYFNE